MVGFPVQLEQRFNAVVFSLIGVFDETLFAFLFLVFGVEFAFECVLIDVLQEYHFFAALVSELAPDFQFAQHVGQHSV